MAENTGLASANLSAGDDWTAVRHNYIVTDIRKLRQESMTAGATINGATLPVPIYQNTSDNEVYACDANVASALEFLGFAISNGTNGNPIIVQHTGTVGGFTGLTEGARYYVQDTAGTIGTSKGTYEVFVGIAISETELFIMKAPSDRIYRNGTATRDFTTASGTQNIAHGLGKAPKKIKLTAFFAMQANSVGVYNGTTRSTVYLEFDSNGSVVTPGSSASDIIYIEYGLSSADIQKATVTINATNIVLAWTKVGSTTTGIINILWEAVA